MLLGILGAIALAVGTIETANDFAETQRLALDETNPAIVQVVESKQDLGFPDPDMGL